MENKNLVWHAPEFTTHKKSTSWYVVFAIVSIGLLAYGWFSHNLLTLVTFIVIVVMAYFFSHQKPQEIEYELSAVSVRAGRNVYPYRNIKNFWIIYTPQNKTVNFETTAYVNNQLSLQLGKEDPVRVREFLKQYVPEDLDKEESFTDILARKIKF